MSAAELLLLSLEADRQLPGSLDTLPTTMTTPRSERQPMVQITSLLGL